MRHILSCALAVVAPAVPAAAAQADYAGLIAADRAFSDAGKGKPLPEALAAIFDRDAVMIAGGPDFVRGADAIRARIAAKPENVGATIEWSPVGGGVSADGTHGFTYGGMTVRRADGVAQPLKYLAYWVKRPEGWRVFGYKRIGAKDGIVLAAAAPIIGRRAKRADDAARSLKAAESGFSDEAQTIGLRAAFRKWGRPDSINLGAAEAIAVGAEAIGEGVAGPEPTSSVTWAADEVMVAPSGDMGLSYGLLHVNRPRAGGPTVVPFFTVWARPAPGEPWRYVAE